MIFVASTQEAKYEATDKYLRRNNVVIHGIPYYRDEDPLQKALEIIQGVNIDIQLCDLDAAYRLKTRK